MTDFDEAPDDAIVLVLHGPNLNLLGQREPHIYGTSTMDDYVNAARLVCARYRMGVESFQSNYEGQVVEAIHAARGRCAGIIINAGALTHYAWSLHDALRAFPGPIVEVHISNPNAREAWRHTSVVAPVATGTIVGLGMHGYELAALAMARLLGRG